MGEPSSVFVGRQPIYDRDMKVYAYEILYRSGNVGQAGVLDGNVATSQVLLNTFLEIGLERLTSGLPAFFNFTREFLLNPDLDFPKGQVVLEVLENIDIDAEIVAAVQRLSQAGYKIALDDFVFEPKWKPLLELADVIKVEVPALTPESARDKVRTLRPYRAKLLAEKVETHEEYELYRKLGFHLFQGYFFCKPKVIEAKSSSTNQLGVLRLVSTLQKPDIEVGELEKILASDASLSYKLLKYLNSPGFGLTHKITSIRQAVTYLGLRTLRTWVTILSMASIQGKPSELSRISLQRARKCETLATALGANDKEQFFLTGLLSSLDAMLDMPMSLLVKELPLSEEVVTALIHGTGETGRVLNIVLSAEKGEWDTALNLLANATIPLNDLMLQATFWADEQMAEILKA